MNTVAIKNTAEEDSIVLSQTRPRLLEYRGNVKRLRDVIEPMMGFVGEGHLFARSGPINLMIYYQSLSHPTYP